MRVTIKDIARLANVSTTTVSLILNDKGDRFSKETIEKVMRIAKENHYYPDFYARNLITKGNKTIGVILPDLTDFFFGQLFEGIEETFVKAGYSVMLYHSNHDKEREREGIKMMLERSVTGIIFATPYALTSEELSDITNRCPIVLMDRGCTPRDEGKIFVDEKSGMIHAVQYLYEQGYRKLALIRENESYYQLSERTEGFYEGLKQCGLEVNENRIVTNALSAEGGYEATKQLIERNVEFDALMCVNDYMAFGAMRALQKAGYRIPEDIALVGYDDIEMASYMMPSLTTVQQPIYQLGIEAAEALISKVNDPQKAIRNRTLETTLIVRESTK